MCAARACPRGASLRHCPPIPTWGWEGGLLPFPGQLCSSSRTSCPPTFLFAPPPGFYPLRLTGTLGYCFRVGVTSGVREQRLGAGPGCTALTMPRSRVGDTPAGRRLGNLRVPEWAPRREICRSFLPVFCRPCCFPDFSKIQIPAYPCTHLKRFRAFL